MSTLTFTSVVALSDSHFVRITIPFEFVIKDKVLPPGDYIVKRSVSENPEMLLIRSVDGSRGAYVLTSNVQANTRQNESKLVFHRYGDQYFLSQVWTAGETAGRELPKSGRERAVDRQMAATQCHTVTLIARR
jgi:hypothetical protein